MSSLFILRTNVWNKLNLLKLQQKQSVISWILLFHNFLAIIINLSFCVDMEFIVKLEEQILEIVVSSFSWQIRQQTT